jgi:hypothetical protein
LEASWSFRSMISRVESQAASPALVCPLLLPVAQWFVMLDIEPCMQSLDRWQQKGRADARGFCPCLCITTDTRQNRASLQDIRTELGRDPSKVCCSWKRHSEERSTEDVVLLGTVLRVFPNSLSGLAGLDRRAHLIKQSKTHPLMKMMMISGRGDGGGKQVFRRSSSSRGDPQRAQQF